MVRLYFVQEHILMSTTHSHVMHKQQAITIYYNERIRMSKTKKL